jgi:hydroxymethylglutaryl-CoA reductase (NADPH)
VSGDGPPVFIFLPAAIAFTAQEGHCSGFFHSAFSFSFADIGGNLSDSFLTSCWFSSYISEQPAIRKKYTSIPLTIMASTNDKAQNALERISALQSIDTLITNIQNKSSNPPAGINLPFEPSVTQDGTNKRLQFLMKETGKGMEFLTGKKAFSDLNQLEGNIENYIGMSMVPTGIVGPLRVIGSAANGDFYVPLATSEGALIASYHRGARACNLAGGATSICLVEGVQRSPLFKFNDIVELGQFLIWLLPQMDEFKRITELTSRYAKLTEIRSNIEGNHLILTFEYHTGDASGQNMVTLCTVQYAIT